jgi:hypothetical protein
MNTKFGKSVVYEWLYLQTVYEILFVGQKLLIIGEGGVRFEVTYGRQNCHRQSKVDINLISLKEIL